MAAQAVDFTLSGQVTRALFVTDPDDGSSTVQFKDDGSSQTRFRMTGSGELVEGSGTMAAITSSSARATPRRSRSFARRAFRSPATGSAR